MHAIEKCSLSKKGMTLTHIFLDRIDEWELWCEHAKTTMFTWTMANKFPGTAGCKTCILTWLISIPIFKMIHHFKAFCVAPVAFQAASPIRQHKTPHQFYRFNYSVSCLPKPGPIRHLIYLIMSSARSHHSLVAFQQNADIYINMRWKCVHSQTGWGVYTGHHERCVNRNWETKFHVISVLQMPSSYKLTNSFWLDTRTVIANKIKPF